MLRRAAGDSTPGTGSMTPAARWRGIGPDRLQDLVPDRDLARPPWRRREHVALAAEAESPHERRLSQRIRSGGPGPKPSTVKASTAIMTEGEAAERIVLVLDGMVEVEAGGTA